MQYNRPFGTQHICRNPNTNVSNIHPVFNFLGFESFPMLLIASKWLIEQLPMILQVFLAFDMDLHL